MLPHTKLRVWQQARRTSLDCLALARDHWQPRVRPVFDQLLRASLSVQLNLAEGYAVASKGRKLSFWTTAYGSAIETVNCLELLSESGMVPNGQADALLQQSRGCAIGILMLLKAQRKRG
ncbi:MAG TPA: four helix bundle protein [Gemmatimonadales bacterium]